MIFKYLLVYIISTYIINIIVIFFIFKKLSKNMKEKELKNMVYPLAFYLFISPISLPIAFILLLINKIKEMTI